MPHQGTMELRENSGILRVSGIVRDSGIGKECFPVPKQTLRKGLPTDSICKPVINFDVLLNMQINRNINTLLIVILSFFVN